MAKTEFELFEAWARAKGHYPVVAAIERYKKMRGSRNGDEPVLSAAAMALVDKLQDED